MGNPKKIEVYTVQNKHLQNDFTHQEHALYLAFYKDIWAELTHRNYKSYQILSIEAKSSPERFESKVKRKIFSYSGQGTNMEKIRNALVDNLVQDLRDQCLKENIDTLSIPGE